MTQKTISKNLGRLGSYAALLVLALGSFLTVQAQRDPFEVPSWKKPKPVSGSKGTGSAGSSGATAKPAPPPVMPVAAAPIESRIAFFKRQREEAANNGSSLPKVTSVITLDEIAVTGIFKTPRGYAAMVEAKPIKLSYAIYPGEKFFDGQLVAIEENRLIFRKVTKMSNGKFVPSVETKALRRYTQDQEVQGTAPAGSETVASEAQRAPSAVPDSVVVSPLEEMNRQKPSEKTAPAPAGGKSSRKSAKVAGVRK